MLNVSSEGPGVGAGVLVRALEPRAGIARMQALRGDVRADLTRGPGRLAQALDIDLRLDGVDLCAPGELWLAASASRAPIGESTRIGLTKDAERVLRFYERGSPWVSGPRRPELRLDRHAFGAVHEHHAAVGGGGAQRLHRMVRVRGPPGLGALTVLEAQDHHQARLPVALEHFRIAAAHEVGSAARLHLRGRLVAIGRVGVGILDVDDFDDEIRR